MAKLIKLDFEPLFPVCDGVLIFHCNATNEAEIKEAVENIRVSYLDWVPLCELTVTYLGEFEPAFEGQFEDNVITYQNGNY